MVNKKKTKFCELSYISTTVCEDMYIFKLMSKQSKREAYHMRSVDVEFPLVELQ